MKSGNKYFTLTMESIMLIKDLLNEKQTQELDMLLNEAALDLPANMSLPEMFDEGYRRFTAARKALGLSNKLTNPADRKRHKSKIMTAINQLRNLLGEIAKQLGYDKD